ncbi:MAG: 2-polyprenylphenol 6-hydroxylase [Alphaproteobacteria bacterium]
MIAGTVNFFRLLGLARTLARHDALWPLQPIKPLAPALRIIKLLWGRKRPGRKGERLASALESLGPSFIKLGQALSVRADLLGDDVAEDLSRLQDRLPPFPTDQAKAAIEAEFGAPIDSLFTTFENEPVAAASIAQVHFATTDDGRDVAVKVLRPNIEERFERDIDLFFWLARLAERFAPSTKRLRPVDVVTTFQDWARTEMDLRLEGAAASELADNCRGDEGFRVIDVDWIRTGRRVLTTERIFGTRIDDLEGLRAAGHDIDLLLERSAKVFFLQVFRDGFFHADMHPGNMFVDADGLLTPVDFGIMGRVDRRTRMFLADMLLGFLERDYAKVADVHFTHGLVPRHKSREAFMQSIRSIGEPVHGRPLNEISIGKLLAQLFKVTEDFDMETQPDLLLLQKTMLVAEGVGRRLNPDVNMWLLARPLIEDWMLVNRGPAARIRDTVTDAADLMERLPRTLRKAEQTLDRLAELTAEAETGPKRGGLGRVLRSGQQQGWAPMMIAVLAALLIAALYID